MIEDINQLKKGMVIKVRSFVTFGDWIKVRIEKINNGVVFVKDLKYQLTMSFPFEIAEIKK